MKYTLNNRLCKYNYKVYHFVDIDNKCSHGIHTKDNDTTVIWSQYKDNRQSHQLFNILEPHISQ